MNISALIQALRTLLKGAFDHRNDPSRWEGWIDLHGDEDEPKTIKLNGKFKKVKIELSGLRFELDLDGEAVVLEALPDPHNLHRLAVKLNGEIDPEAGVANPTPKPSAQHLGRIALDVRPVTFRGHETRFNLRFNG